jgi:hypothetical protein
MHVCSRQYSLVNQATVFSANNICFTLLALMLTPGVCRLTARAWMLALSMTTRPFTSVGYWMLGPRACSKDNGGSNRSDTAAQQQAALAYSHTMCCVGEACNVQVTNRVIRHNYALRQYAAKQLHSTKVTAVADLSQRLIVHHATQIACCKRPWIVSSGRLQCTGRLR